MSNLVWPALPFQSPQLDRSSDFDTTIVSSVSGKEQRTSWRVNPRHHFRLFFPALRENVLAPGFAYSEVGVIFHFWDTHRGEFDSFLYNDRNPNTGATVQRRVRFAKKPSLSRLRGGGSPGTAVWEGEVEFIEVL